MQIETVSTGNKSLHLNLASGKVNHVKKHYVGR